MEEYVASNDIVVGSSPASAKRVVAKRSKQHPYMVKIVGSNPAGTITNQGNKMFKRMFGKQNAVVYQDGEFNKFHYSDQKVPEDDSKVITIGKKYFFHEDATIGISSYDPTDGWKGSHEIVYAWIPMTEQVFQIITQFSKS